MTYINYFISTLERETVGTKQTVNINVEDAAGRLPGVLRLVWNGLLYCLQAVKKLEPKEQTTAYGSTANPIMLHGKYKTEQKV